MKEWNLKISNNLTEISTVVESIDILAEKWNLSEKLKFNLNLVIEELITNTISYGYKDEDAHEISINFYLENKLLKLIITDDAIEFNPLNQDSPDDLDKPLAEKQIGGLGIHLVKNLMDKLEYKRDGDKNILTLTKTID